MNMPKPDTFVLVVAALSEKLVQKENECFEVRLALTNAEEELSDIRANRDRLYDECDNLRIQVQNLQDTNDRQRRTISDLDYKAQDNTYYKNRCATLEQELLSLKYGGETDPHKRAISYMEKEGGKLWAEGNKIQCIKGVRECTGWGLKEAKDYSEAEGPKFAPKLLQEESGPHTKPSEDLARKVG